MPSHRLLALPLLLAGSLLGAVESQELETPRPAVVGIPVPRLEVERGLRFDFSRRLDLPENHIVTVGSRASNPTNEADAYGAEAVVTWSYELSGTSRPFRHTIGVLAAVGGTQRGKATGIAVGSTGGVFSWFEF